MNRLPPPRYTRRSVLRAGVAATLALAWQHTSAQTSDLPDRAITLLVPFAAGGATDVVSRLIAQYLGQQLQRSVVVENMSGGGGTIGAARVARAAADGTTLLMATIASHVLNPLSMPGVAYDPQRDFTPISLVATVPCVLLVNPNVPVHTVQELIALLKSQPGRFNYASSGVGTPTHLSGELFKALIGVQMTHIPYKGGGPATIDLIAGHVPIYFDVLSGAAAHIRAGSVRALAVTTRERTAAFPDLPTIAESGVAGYESWTWNALFAPANLPPAIAQELSRAVQTVVALPEVRARLQELSATPVGSTPEALTALVASETKKWGGIIESMGGLQRD